MRKRQDHGGILSLLFEIGRIRRASRWGSNSKPLHVCLDAGQILYAGVCDSIVAVLGSVLLACGTSAAARLAVASTRGGLLSGFSAGRV